MELENDEQQVTNSSEKQEFSFIIDDLGLDNIDTIENYETLETKIDDHSQTTLTQESEEK